MKCPDMHTQGFQPPPLMRMEGQSTKKFLGIA